MPQTITVDATPDEKTIHRRPTLYFSQGDVGRAFTINLFSRDGYEVPSGSTVKIQATKPSGLGFSVAATSVTNGVASFTSTAAMADEFGKFPAEAMITKSGTVIGTANFNICVERNPHPDGTTDGQSEEVIPELTVLVERIEAAAESIHDLNTTATTLPAGSSATATYNSQTNTIAFGIPKGMDGFLTDNTIYFTDPNSDGNIVISVQS